MEQHHQPQVTQLEQQLTTLHERQSGKYVQNSRDTELQIHRDSAILEVSMCRNLELQMCRGLELQLCRDLITALTVQKISQSFKCEEN